MVGWAEDQRHSTFAEASADNAGIRLFLQNKLGFIAKK
jgi:hypothetical protein